jgi:hypothetical protein
LLGNASLFSLSFRNRWTRPLCHPRLLISGIITTLPLSLDHALLGRFLTGSSHVGYSLASRCP